MNDKLVSILLGKEYDNILIDTLYSVLKRNYAEVSEETWSLVGSQEVITIHVKIEKYVITIELETYIGLSITGDKIIVDRLTKEVYQQLNINHDIRYI